MCDAKLNEWNAIAFPMKLANNALITGKSRCKKKPPLVLVKSDLNSKQLSLMRPIYIE